MKLEMGRAAAVKSEGHTLRYPGFVFFFPLLTLFPLLTKHPPKYYAFARDIKSNLMVYIPSKKKGKRKVQGVPQSQTAALPRPQEEEETDKSKQAQTEQTYEKH